MADDRVDEYATGIADGDELETIRDLKDLELEACCDRCGSDRHTTRWHEDVELQFFLNAAETAFQEEQVSGVYRRLKDAQEGTEAPETRTANRPVSVSPTAFERGDHTELAERLIKHLQGDGVGLVYDDGALYRYEPREGLWRTVSEDEQSRVIQAFAGTALAGEKRKVLRVNHADVRGAIRLAGSNQRTIGFFGTAPARGIAFSNGFVAPTRDGIELQTHDPSNKVRSGYSFPFVLDAHPPEFLAFLDDVFRDDSDKEAKINFVQEFGGIALLGLAPGFAHCFVATSKNETSGANGKSQLAFILQGMMPQGSVSSTRPQDFDNEYRRAGLAGKLLNAVGEMPEGEILESASFKAIITGDEIEGRHIREAPFTFKPTAAHYYACNTPPSTSDFSKGFFRRFIFVEFNRTFESGDPGFVVDIGKRILEREKELLPSWFLRGAVRVLRQGAYTHVPSSDTAIDLWRRGVDQVASFIEEMTSKATSAKPSTGKHDWTEAAQVYRAYVQWARDTGHSPLASNKFGVRMGQLKLGWQRTNRGHFYPVKLR